MIFALVLPSHEHVPPLAFSLFMTTTTTTTTTTISATTTTSTSTIAPTPLQDATAKSTQAWQTDLEALFHRAKDRFPDVVWALLTEEDAEQTGEQVYGHKGIYLRLLFISLPARTPPNFSSLSHPHCSPPSQPPVTSRLIRIHSYCIRSRSTKLPSTIFLISPCPHIISRPPGCIFSIRLSYPVRSLSFPRSRNLLHISLPLPLSPCIARFTKSRWLDAPDNFYKP